MSVNLNNATDVVSLLEGAARQLREHPARRGCCVTLPASGRLLATGDLHDHPVHLAKILRLARLDESADHHLVLHELIHGDRLINGLDFSYRMLTRVAELVQRYPRQVHPVLANHEVAQLTGKGVTKGAANSVQLFDDAMTYVFADAAAGVRKAVHTFIRAMPLALKSEQGVFCAHSLPADRVIEMFDPTILERDLEAADYCRPHGDAYHMVWGRGYSVETVERLARLWNVRLFCLGHEHVESGFEVRAGRVVVLNSDHEHGMTLPIDLASPPGAEEAIYHVVPLASVPEPQP